MATQQESTGQTYPVYICDLCGKRQDLVGRCQGCGHPQLRELQVGAEEYCFFLGHDGGEMLVPNSAREEGTHFVSHEYLFRCARCGFESRTRR